MKLKGVAVWFWVRARRLGQDGLARSARRALARKSVVGGILEWVKKCDGFSAELGVRVVCFLNNAWRAGLITAWRIWIFARGLKENLKILF